MDKEVVQELVDKAIEAKTYSYSPYSKFRVGCSLLTNDNKIYTGCNVENASYGLAICAERTALVKAVSEGHRIFKAIAVSTDLDMAAVSPCGACRQFIAEFGLDWTIILIKNQNEYQEHRVSDILPLAFDSSLLELHKLKHLNGMQCKD